MNALDQRGLEWTSFHCKMLPVENDTSDHDIGDIISFSSQWEAVDLGGFHNVGPRAVMALSHHCERLRNLDVSCHAHISSKGLCTILSKARHLEIFMVLGPIRRGQNFDCFDFGPGLH